MEPKIKLELDVAHDALEEALAEAANYDLEADVVEEVGPAGGNPLVSFVGLRDDLRRFLAEIYCGENGDGPDFYLAMAVPS